MCQYLRELLTVASFPSCSLLLDQDPLDQRPRVCAQHIIGLRACVWRMRSVCVQHGVWIKLCLLIHLVWSNAFPIIQPPSPPVCGYPSLLIVYDASLSAVLSEPLLAWTEVNVKGTPSACIHRCDLPMGQMRARMENKTRWTYPRRDPGGLVSDSSHFWNGV